MQAFVAPYHHYRIRFHQSFLSDGKLRRPGDQEHHLVWYAVAAIILFALGVTILLGAIAYCSLKGMYFGAYYWQNPWTVKVGCWPG